MKMIHKIGMVRAIYLILIYKHAIILCGEDESTVEIVLLNNGTEKEKSSNGGVKGPATENKYRELKNILTTLVSHFLAGSRFKNNLLKNYDGADQPSVPKEGNDKQKPTDHRKDEGVGNLSPQEPTIEMLEKIRKNPHGI
ncbi:hypothetical protein EROM_071470 [Encephalitozoon romaleae SJ-2008]|uniref:Uncharacterized protein n=1 Tax=Encephalitozoon romaleae (strain SJ-2008) TaxID=1178016 RepID=I6ZJH9_ENCRO|nr:hypothetical protein EROM_071470 [Encephalitozoon romaleae SJ-2008]AFN83398.1 hypothetical protein EROM_071470 [Encephalitozoon romaleae SJ-2008]